MENTKLSGWPQTFERVYIQYIYVYIETPLETPLRPAQEPSDRRGSHPGLWETTWGSSASCSSAGGRGRASWKTWPCCFSKIPGMSPLPSPVHSKCIEHFIEHHSTDLRQRFNVLTALIRRDGWTGSPWKRKEFIIYFRTKGFFSCWPTCCWSTRLRLKT